MFFWKKFFLLFESDRTLLQEAKIIHETEKAYLVEHVDQKVWVPKSLVYKVGEKGVSIASWFVRKHFA